MGREFDIEAGAVETVEGKERCIVRARVPADLRYLEGHFPDRPIVPGVAQLVPLVHEQVRRAWPHLGAPTSIKRLKFLETLWPGDELEVRLTRDGDRVRFEIVRGETPCSHGTLTFRGGTDDAPAHS